MKDTIEALKVDMQNAADEVELATFMKDIAAVTQILASRRKFTPDMAAYALATVACAVADASGNRQPVMCGLADSWPEIFQEVSEKEFRELKREIAQRNLP
jgi:hypothetical protein